MARHVILIFLMRISKVLQGMCKEKDKQADIVRCDQYGSKNMSQINELAIKKNKDDFKLEDSLHKKIIFNHIYANLQLKSPRITRSAYI